MRASRLTLPLAVAAALSLAACGGSGNGTSPTDGGTAGGKLATDDYAKRYHQPSDEFNADWNLDGVVLDLEALYGVGRTLADGSTAGRG